MLKANLGAQEQVEGPGEVVEVPNNDEREIEKEITKMKFYGEQIHDLVDENDVLEIKMVNQRMEDIHTQLLALISQVQEAKISNGESSRDVRQWKKTIKESFMPWVNEKERLTKVLKDQQEEVRKDKEREMYREAQSKLEAEQKKMNEIYKMQAEFEEEARKQRYQLEKEMWEEKLKAEQELVEKRLEAGKHHHIDQAKLPKLKITPFNGTAVDWVRFENMFITQVHNKEVADEVKFGYLLEMVCPKVREKISNLRPGTTGYKTAWDRLTREYGQTQTVVNAHVSEIINLPTVRGTNYERIVSFYEKLSKCYDALQTLEKETSIGG